MRMNANGFRASQVSARFANELLLAQQKLQGQMLKWGHSLFVALAGEDRVADTAVAESLLADVSVELLEKHLYENNYHENFNEVNREEIYQAILKWLDSRVF